MNPTEAFERLGSDVTATFGCQIADGIAGVESEIVGPLNPRSVYYGTVWRNESASSHPLTRAATHGARRREYPASPLVFFNFNKYRPDLPPWGNVSEFVLAAQDDGDVYEVTFEGAVEPQGVAVTGDLKTVSLASVYAHEGVETETFTRSDVAEKRDMGGNVCDGGEFRVDGVLE
jgi:hypothetical protein